MSETAEGEDVGGGGFTEEEAMKKRHKKESGVSKFMNFLTFYHLIEN